MHITRVTAPTPAITSLASATAEQTTSKPAVQHLWPSWLAMMLARRAERQQLLALDERDLRDIGLTPSEAWSLAQAPLWRR